MKNQLINPLQGLISKASTTLAKQTGHVAQAQERITRIKNRPSVVLADVSGSMASPAWGGRTKHAVLREAIAATLQAGKHELLAFSDRVTSVTSAASLPPADGGTALHLALDGVDSENGI